MKHKHRALCNSLSIDYEKPISRSQLPKVLEKISRERFQTLLYKHYGIKLDETEEEWFAGDACPEIRDVTLQEDKLRTKFSAISRNIAAIRTLIVNVLLDKKPKNMIALLERFQDDFEYLILFLRQINFL